MLKKIYVEDWEEAAADVFNAKRLRDSDMEDCGNACL